MPSSTRAEPPSLHDVISAAQCEPYNLDRLLPPVLASPQLPECLYDMILHRTSRHILCDICNATHSYSEHDFRAYLVHSTLLGRAYALTAPSRLSSSAEDQTLHAFARLPVELRSQICEQHSIDYNHHKELYTAILGICARAALLGHREYPVLYAACILILTCGNAVSNTPDHVLNREKRRYTGTKYQHWDQFRRCIVEKLGQSETYRQDEYVPQEVKDIVALVKTHITEGRSDLTSKEVTDLCLGNLATTDVQHFELGAIFEWDMAG